MILEKNKIKSSKEINKYNHIDIKNQSGITIVALVITIIILIILAGISIGSITNDNGIINQATTAKNNVQYQQWSEQIDTAIIDAESKHVNPTIDDVIQELKNKGIISNDDQVNKTTGEITTNDPQCTIDGKLDDYL